ncbi:hypothetical protein Tco_1418642 [Tanacetum coccineum]
MGILHRRFVVMWIKTGWPLVRQLPKNAQIHVVACLVGRHFGTLIVECIVVVLSDKHVVACVVVVDNDMFPVSPLLQSFGVVYLGAVIVADEGLPWKKSVYSALASISVDCDMML